MGCDHLHMAAGIGEVWDAFGNERLTCTDSTSFLRQGGDGWECMSPFHLCFLPSIAVVYPSSIPFDSDALFNT